MTQRRIASNILIYVSLTSAALSLGAKHTKIVKPSPTEFTIGRDTFFDFGPPFHYFEGIAVQSNQDKTRVVRILITPPGDPCLQLARIEVQEAAIPKSIDALLEHKNPCSKKTSTEEAYEAWPRV